MARKLRVGIVGAPRGGGYLLHERKPPIDIHDALDFTVPGLVSQESIRRGSVLLPVPDFHAMHKFPEELPAELRQSGILRVREETRNH
jgi:hypothetical protein